MSRRPFWIAYPVVWLLSLGWFALFQPWGGFNDPDAFYHAKISELLLTQGPLHEFPWLDLTLFDKGFSDHHFLFHLILLPFIKLFGTLSGTQVGAVVLAATFITVFYAVLKNLRMSHPEIWTGLAMISSPLLIRLSLAKASPLALLWFVLGLWVMTKHLESREASRSYRRWLLLAAMVIGFVYAWSHGGWIIVLVGQGLLVFGDFLLNRFVFDRGWRASVAWSSCAVVAATMAGAVIGTLAHPNFPQSVLFLKTLLIDISLKVPFEHVRLGDEWQPAGVGELASSIGPLLVAVGFILFGLVSALKRPLQSHDARRVIGYGLLTALFLALTFKSRRAAEYFIPVFVLWLASLWTLVDVPRAIASAKMDWERLAGSWRRPLAGFIMVLFLTLFIHDVHGTWSVLHTYVHPFREFQPAMQRLSERARPGDRVFHSDWDLFPQLWVLDDRLNYIAGMDPTMLWKYRPDLSDAYREIALGEAGAESFDRIQKLFQARFVFLERAQHEAFEQVLMADARFQEIYQDAEVRVYELSTEAH